MSGHERTYISPLFEEGIYEEMLVPRHEPRIPDDYVPEVLPPTGEKLIIEVNKERTEEVLGQLLRTLELNEPPYNQDHLRQPNDPRNMPSTLERGGIDHAMYLFNLCLYMRGGIKSNIAGMHLSKVYDAYPELFNCETAISFSQDDIISILKDNGLSLYNMVAKAWIENSQRLLEKFGGDPRKIFEGVSTYGESQALIQNDDKGGGFIGFQAKMTSMLLHYLMDDNLIEKFNFPVPVDIHVMRVSIANEMITFPNAPHGTNLYTDETTAVLRKLYFDYTAESGASPLRLCDAVWMLSESSCGKHPGNRTLEPLGRSVRSGRSAYLVAAVVDIDDPSQQAAYESSCGKCPIEETCEYNIPGTQYYATNNLIIRGPRARFPLPKSIVQLPLLQE